MGSDIFVGLQLSVIGLAVTFLALGLLISVMYLLLRVFPVKSPTPQELPVEQHALVDEEEQHLEEMAVAMAVGISLLEREGAFVQRDPTLGKLLENK